MALFTLIRQRRFIFIFILNKKKVARALCVAAGFIYLFIYKI